MIYHNLSSESLRGKPVWALLLCRRRSSRPSVGWRPRCGECWRPSSRLGRPRETLVIWWCFSTQSSAQRRTSRNSRASSSGSSSTRIVSTCRMTHEWLYYSMSSLHIWFSKLKWSLDVLLRFYERHAFICALHKVSLFVLMSTVLTPFMSGDQAPVWRAHILPPAALLHPLPPGHALQLQHPRGDHDGWGDVDSQSWPK